MIGRLIRRALPDPAKQERQAMLTLYGLRSGSVTHQGRATSRYEFRYVESDARPGLRLADWHRRDAA